MTEMDLLLDRLRRIESQNDEQLKLLHKHLDDDAKIAQIVASHTSWFKIVGGVLSALSGTVLIKLFKS